MKFELFVALRYLRARRKQTMVSVISAISIVGIAAGVMALVIALALSTGFKEDIQSKIIGATSAVNLLRIDSTYILDSPELATQDRRRTSRHGKCARHFQPGIHFQLRAQPGCFLERSRSGPRRPGVGFLFPHHCRKPTGACHTALPAGEDQSLLRWRAFSSGKKWLARWECKIGDTLKVFYPVGRMTPLGMTASEKTLRVAAIFESGLWDIDSNWAYVNIDSARRLFSFPRDSVSVIQFKTDNLESAEAIADDIRARAGEGFITTTWIELNKPLFSALKLEKLVLFLTIGLIVFVASLNIVTTLIMMVLEKQGDIAILTAMGATSKTIQRVFMLQGMIIGLIGTVLGQCPGDGDQLDSEYLSADQAGAGSLQHSLCPISHQSLGFHSGFRNSPSDQLSGHHLSCPKCGKTGSGRGPPL